MLPDKPLVVIERNTSWTSPNLAELWDHRELLWFLVWRDVKVRYKQTALGAAWAVIQPLLTMLVFTYFFGLLARIPSDGIPYPLFFYTGLVVWSYFSNAVNSGANSLHGNANLITKVYFPRLIIPMSSVVAGLVDFAIASVLLLVLIAYYGVTPDLGILLLPGLVFLTALLALGFAVFLAALNVRYRDVRYTLTFVIQIWMFLSPIIYPSSMVPGQWRWLLRLNPITGLIEGYRSAFFGSPMDWPALAYSFFFGIAMILHATYTFRRMEKSFAEVI